MAKHIVKAHEGTVTTGGSNKFYRVYQIGCDTKFQYDAIGSFGTWKTKTHASVEAAEKVAAKQIRDKRSKSGYVPQKELVLEFDHYPTDAELDAAVTAGKVTGTVTAAVDPSAVVTVVDTTPFVTNDDLFDDLLDTLRIGHADDISGGVRDAVIAMLATDVEATEHRVDSLVASPLWASQLKYDGQRYVVEVVDGEVAVYNRGGAAKKSNVNQALLAPFRNLAIGRWVFDGEYVGGTLVIFDMFIDGHLDPTRTSFTRRYDALAAIFPILFAGCGDIVLAPTAVTKQAKEAMFADAKARRLEGVIYRDTSSAYEFGRSTCLLRHKFTSTADCVVVEVGKGGKNNIVVALNDANGSLVEVGNVTAIGKGDFVVGDVAEIEFLYVNDPKSPKLYQPRVACKRTDKTADECLLSQLDGKHTNKTAV